MRGPKKYPTKRGTVVVAWPEIRNGKAVRRRREFSDAGEAEARYQELLRLYPSEGASGLSMRSEQRAEYHAAKSMLPEGVTLDQAARYWLAMHPSGDSLGAGAALEEYLAHASKTDRSDSTGTRRKQALERFIADMGVVDVSGVTVEAIERWLWRNGNGPITIRNDASQLRGWCKWLVKRKRALSSNPLDLIALPSLEDPDPKTLDAGQVRALMDAAAAYRGGELAPFFAIAVFAGLRPAEIARLTADVVKLDAAPPFLRVRKLKKGRGVRLTPINPTLKAWLAAHPPKAWPLPYARKKYRSVIQKAGLAGDWQANAMRHTYISMRLAMGIDDAQVAKESGNSVEVIHRHYKDLLTEAEAEAIAAVMPNA